MPTYNSVQILEIQESGFQQYVEYDILNFNAIGAPQSLRHSSFLDTDFLLETEDGLTTLVLNTDYELSALKYIFNYYTNAVQTVYTKVTLLNVAYIGQNLRTRPKYFADFIDGQFKGKFDYLYADVEDLMLAEGGKIAWREDRPYVTGDIVSDQIFGETKFFIAVQASIGNDGVSGLSPSGDTEKTYWKEFIDSGVKVSSLFDKYVGVETELSFFPVIATVNTSGEIIKADNSITGLQNAMGVVENLDGEKITVIKTGFISGFTGLTVGSMVYLAQNGGISQDPSSFSPLDSRVPLGVAVTATTIDFNIGEPKEGETPFFFDGIPVGTIVLSTLDTDVPTGMMLADGRTISRTLYSDLHTKYAALGYPYGIGDGSTTFGIPLLDDPDSNLRTLVKVRYVGQLSTESDAQIDERLHSLETNSLIAIGEVPEGQVIDGDNQFLFFDGSADIFSSSIGTYPNDDVSNFYLVKPFTTLSTGDVVPNSTIKFAERNVALFTTQDENIYKDELTVTGDFEVETFTKTHYIIKKSVNNPYDQATNCVRANINESATDVSSTLFFYYKKRIGSELLNIIFNGVTIPLDAATDTWTFVGPITVPSSVEAGTLSTDGVATLFTDGISEVEFFNIFLRDSTKETDMLEHFPSSVAANKINYKFRFSETQYTIDFWAKIYSQDLGRDTKMLSVLRANDLVETFSLGVNSLNELYFKFTDENEVLQTKSIGQVFSFYQWQYFKIVTDKTTQTFRVFINGTEIAEATNILQYSGINTFPNTYGVIKFNDETIPGAFLMTDFVIERAVDITNTHYIANEPYYSPFKIKGFDNSFSVDRFGYMSMKESLYVSKYENIVYRTVRVGKGSSLPKVGEFGDEWYLTTTDEWYKFNGEIWIQI